MLYKMTVLIREKVFICTFTRNIVKASDKICLAFILKNDIEKDKL